MHSLSCRGLKDTKVLLVMLELQGPQDHKELLDNQDQLDPSDKRYTMNLKIVTLSHLSLLCTGTRW